MQMFRAIARSVTTSNFSRPLAISGAWDFEDPAVAAHHRSSRPSRPPSRTPPPYPKVRRLFLQVITPKLPRTTSAQNVAQGAALLCSAAAATMPSVSSWRFLTPLYRLKRWRIHLSIEETQAQLILSRKQFAGVSCPYPQPAPSSGTDVALASLPARRR